MGGLAVAAGVGAGSEAERIDPGRIVARRIRGRVLMGGFCGDSPLSDP